MKKIEVLLGKYGPIIEVKLCPTYLEISQRGSLNQVEAVTAVRVWTSLDGHQTIRFEPGYPYDVYVKDWPGGVATPQDE